MLRPLISTLELLHMNEKFLVGALEKVNLNELRLLNLIARIDTGAQTSSLHATNIREITNDGQPWVEFDCILDDQNRVHAKSPIKGERFIKSSNGSERRFVIESQIQLGEHSWPIQLTLSDRSNMAYPMLLGREAMAGRVIVDPSLDYLI